MIWIGYQNSKGVLKLKVRITIIHSLKEGRDDTLFNFEDKLNQFLVKEGLYQSSETSEFSPEIIMTNPEIYYNRLSQTYHLKKKEVITS